MEAQYIEILSNGSKFYYKDRAMTIFHRTDGPAIEWSNVDKEWWVNGELHREDGPAVERSTGTKEWYFNGKRHRTDGPAVEWAGGSKEWYINGKPHREDGPATEWSDGSKEWYINGEHLTKAEFKRRTAPEIVLTMDEIAAKLGIDVSKLKIKK